MRLVYMKVFILCGIGLLSAQDRSVFLNVQLHHDFRRGHITATQEFLAFDRPGYTFFFADFNFDHYRKSGGLSDFYFEIMRYFRLKTWHHQEVNLTVQYNDGTEPVKQVWLGGLNVGNLTLGRMQLSTEFLVKKEYRFGLTWQYTLVWSAAYYKDRLVVNGYLDFWTNDNTHPDWPSFDPEFSATRYSFQAEPQVGWMVTSRWKVGTELEISRGFLGSVTGKLATREAYRHDKWYVLPTAFIQYDF